MRAAGGIIFQCAGIPGPTVLVQRFHIRAEYYCPCMLATSHDAGCTLNQCLYRHPGRWKKTSHQDYAFAGYTGKER